MYFFLEKDGKSFARCIIRRRKKKREKKGNITKIIKLKSTQTY